MLSFILKRVLATVPVMGVVALIVFLLLRLSPGDPAAVIAGDYATAEQIEKIRTQLGLNQPILVQFISWLGDLARGDLGVSIFSNLPVSTLIAQRIEPTLMLALHHHHRSRWSSPCRSACSRPGRRTAGSTAP